MPTQLPLMLLALVARWQRSHAGGCRKHIARTTTSVSRCACARSSSRARLIFNGALLLRGCTITRCGRRRERGARCCVWQPFRKTASPVKTMSSRSIGRAPLSLLGSGTGSAEAVFCVGGRCWALSDIRNPVTEATSPVAVFCPRCAWPAALALLRCCAGSSVTTRGVWSSIDCRLVERCLTIHGQWGSCSVVEPTDAAHSSVVVIERTVFLQQKQQVHIRTKMSAQPTGQSSTSATLEPRKIRSPQKEQEQDQEQNNNNNHNNNKQQTTTQEEQNKTKSARNKDNKDNWDNKDHNNYNSTH